MRRLRLPDRPGRVALAAGAAAWAGALVAHQWTVPGMAVVVASAGVSLAVGRRTFAWWLVAVVGAAGAVSGLAAAQAEAAVLSSRLPGGVVEASVVAASDPQPGRYDDRMLVRLPDGRPLLLTGQLAGLEAGDRLRVEGVLVSRPSLHRGDAVAGRLRAREVQRVGGPSALPLRVANQLRRVVLDRIDPEASAGRALLAGFLVGDTRALDRVDDDAMRRAGLSHFVAVSGSNVALFLGLWWLVLAPVKRPAARWVAGLAGLVLFVLITRWEPSVIRASAMAGLVLAGRLVGIPVGSWTALGAGVAGCIVLAGDLATDVGFALSVAATTGVMAGHDLVAVGPRPVRSVLGASLSAQLAVAPILIGVFGTIPLMAPVANLVAAPLVTAATSVGGIGALTGLQALVSAGAGLSHAVLTVAEVAAVWPQVGWVGAGGLAAAVGGVLVGGRWLPVVVALSGVAVAVLLWSPASRVEPPAVVVLDVGQGDAILVLASDLVMLVDGGPDPVRLLRRLDAYGVQRLDLAVATHVHQDHVNGLVAALERFPTGRLWHAFPPHRSPAADRLLQVAGATGVAVETPPPGTTVTADRLSVRVAGPLRTYASPNDQSLVLEVDVGGTHVLLAGDVETWAQADLDVSVPDVLKVPHQGAGTSDPAWLAGHAGSVAVISVGPNDYGHPAPEVISVLERAGAEVLRTDLHGDVVIRPGSVQGRELSSRRWKRAASPSTASRSSG